MRDVAFLSVSGVECFRRPRMVPKNVFIAILCTTLSAWSGLAVADEYRPDQFLGLDLSQAVLSPKPLGPASQFAPVAIAARAERGRARGTHHAFPNPRGASAEREAARRRTHQARPPTRQSARCGGVRYANSGLAMQVGRHLQLAAVRGIERPLAVLVTARSQVQESSACRKTFGPESS